MFDTKNFEWISSVIILRTQKICVEIEYNASIISNMTSGIFGKQYDVMKNWNTISTWFKIWKI